MPFYQFLNQQNAQCCALCEAVDAGVFLIGMNIGATDAQCVDINQPGRGKIITFAAATCGAPLDVHQSR